MEAFQNVKTKSPEQASIRDSYLYRAYIALNKPSVALSEIQASGQSVGLKAVRRFADYQAADVGGAKRKNIVAEVDNELEAPSNVGNDEEGCIHLLMGALILMHEGRVDDALRLLSRAGSDGGVSWLECRSATVQCLLKINRVDLAM